MTYGDKITAQGLVGDFAEYIHNRTGVKPSYAESCSAGFVSTAHGIDVIMPTRIGDLHPNVFAIIVGGSAISAKSVTQDIVDEGIKILSEKVKKDLLLPSRFSTPKLQQILSKQNEGIIVGDEYTKMFRDSFGKHYLDNSMEFLSKLYDGKLPKYATISRGIEYTPIVHVNFLSATTFYLCELMKTDIFFIQGTGCRFLWDVDDRVDEEINGYDSTSFFLSDVGRRERDKQLEDLVNKAYQIRQNVEKIADMSLDDALLLGFEDMSIVDNLSGFMQDQHRKAAQLFNKDPLNPDVGYVARMVENALKLSAIHCLGRQWEDDWVVSLPYIEKMDVDWAIEKTKYHYDQFLKLKSVRDTVQSDMRTRSHKSDFEWILSIIDRNNGVATKTEIMQGTKWLSDTAQRILDGMVIAGFIKTARRTGRGPHSLVYLRPETDIRQFGNLKSPEEDAEDLRRRIT